MGENIENAVTFYELKWDTEFFGVTSAKVILNRPLTLDEWEDLKYKFSSFQFISIVNNNSDPFNSHLIGTDTSAFLADVNVQFIKKIEHTNEMPANVTVERALERNDNIIEIAKFEYSKFVEDSELAKRGGDKLYRQWLINSFANPNKFFALSNDEKGEITGFLLHAYTEEACVIELIAVSQKSTKSGVGKSLFKAVESAASQNGVYEIRVGTQVRNMGAINFYHKVGCKQIGCHQVYHLWNI